jgi:hypothetical protein
LNPHQETSLETFKELCQQKGYFDPHGPNGLPSHDDETMLRYLRARKFVPNEAFGQFKDTEDWRKEIQLEKLYDTIDVKEYEQTRVLVSRGTCLKCNPPYSHLSSILNGLVDEIAVESPCTYSKWPI